MAEAITFSKRKMIAPYALIALALLLAFFLQDYWFLFCLLGIFLGWVCSAPNMNLANGFLAQVALIVGIVLGIFSNRHVLYAGLACWFTWAICSVELGVRLFDRSSERDA